MRAVLVRRPSTVSSDPLQLDVAESVDALADVNEVLQAAVTIGLRPTVETLPLAE